MNRTATRVLLISPLPPPAGGIARWTTLVTGHLRERQDVDVRVVDTALRLRSPRSTSRPRRIFAGSVEALWTIWRCVRATLASRPDVVHINVSGQLGLLRDLLSAQWCRALGIPVVVHLRFGRVPEIAKRKTFEWRLLRRVLKAASVVIAIDRSTAEALAAEDVLTPVRVVPNCVEIMAETEDLAIRDQGAVLYVGWLVPSKGLEELLLAWRQVRREGLSLRLLGGFEVQYLDSLKSRGLVTPDVEVLGELAHSRVLDELRRCGLFVLPSHTEGFPNVVVEAMSAGAPIVATSVGAIPDMLKGGAGVVVAPRDPPALARAMRRVLVDPERWSMGEFARRRAEDEYSVAAVTEQYVSLWTSLARP